MKDRHDVPIPLAGRCGMRLCWARLTRRGRPAATCDREGRQAPSFRPPPRRQPIPTSSDRLATLRGLGDLVDSLVLVVEGSHMGYGVGLVGKSDQDSVVLASFDSYGRAEQMLASLGRDFRKHAHKAGTTAVVVTGNADGSLKLTQSRVLTASGIANAMIRASLASMVGFTGLYSTTKGVQGGVHAAKVRKGHVGADEHQAHRILAQAGPRAAIVLVRCTDQQTRQAVAAAAAGRASDSWDGSLTEFLAQLDPGSSHDWVRTAVGKPSGTHRE